MAPHLSSIHHRVEPSLISSDGVIRPPQPQFLSQPRRFPLHPFAESKPLTRTQRIATRALREWQDYDDAVARKDLYRAIRFLISVQEEEDDDDDELPIKRFDDSSSLSSSSPIMGSSSLTESTRLRISELRSAGWERDWEVLDTCLSADDMKLVGSAYAFLKTKGFLPSFGKFRNIVDMRLSKKAISGIAQPQIGIVKIIHA